MTGDVRIPADPYIRPVRCSPAAASVHLRPGPTGWPEVEGCVRGMQAMGESVTWLAPRLVAGLLAEASGEHVPSYVTREQARAIINAATTQTHRVLRHTLQGPVARLLFRSCL